MSVLDKKYNVDEFWRLEGVDGWRVENIAESVEGSLDKDLLEAPSAKQIIWACSEICMNLLRKNKAYGDSALNPVRIFAKGMDAESQIKVRIDDKLSRLARGEDIQGDDTVLDLIGYFILWRISQKRKRRAQDLKKELEAVSA